MLQTPGPVPVFLSTTDVAELAGIHFTTVIRHAKRGKLPLAGISKRGWRLFHSATVEAWIERRAKAAQRKKAANHRG